MAKPAGVYYRNYDSTDSTMYELMEPDDILSIETIGWSSPSGKGFQEWNTARDGSGISYMPGDEGTDLPLYAIWADVITYITDDQELTSIANAIRTKGGTSASLVYPAGFISAIQNIPSGGTYQAKTNITPTTSSQTITPDSGYDALSSVQINAMPSGTAGTPTATKGTVSNNSVSVTPSVTNTAGYISGGTKTGTAVTVSASELVSGTKTINSSGTTDVTNYANASVAAGSATTPATTITANPSISVNSSGLITATNSKTQSVTPTVSAGYVASGTAGTITVNGSNTSQLTTQAAQTITPTTTDQTIASGKYLTGAQTIKGDANLVAENIAKDVTIFGVTGTHEGGGGMNTLTLYASCNGNSVFGTLFMDEELTESLFERCDFDYHEVWSFITGFDIIKVVCIPRQGASFNKIIVNIISMEADFIEDSVDLYAIQTTSNVGTLVFGVW